MLYHLRQIPAPQDFACVGAQRDCETDADCCNAPFVKCVSNQCNPEDPK
jgi:hypothetical protein